VRALSESHHKWPMPPEPPPAPKATAKPERPQTRSPEDKKLLEEALKRLVPTGRWYWDEKFKLYIPEFEPEGEKGGQEPEVRRDDSKKTNTLDTSRTGPPEVCQAVFTSWPCHDTRIHDGTKQRD
jgi:hypothetical protein